MTEDHLLQIAVIQPEPAQFRSLESELNSAGVQVSMSWFPSTSEAIKLLASADPAPTVILMSWRLGGLNPMEAVRALHAVPRLEHVPIVALAMNKVEKDAAADNGLTAISTPMDQQAIKTIKSVLSLGF